MPLRRKPRRQESALYLHLLADSDTHLPVFRSADLHRRTTIATSGLRWNHRRSKRAIAWLHQLTYQVSSNGRSVGGSAAHALTRRIRSNCDTSLGEGPVGHGHRIRTHL